MYLELAENNNQGYYGQMAQEGEDVSDLYVYIPAQFTDTGEGMYVREDSFDMLPDIQWEQLQDVVEPFQERGLSLFGLGKKGRSRRKGRRDARHQKKLVKMGVRQANIKIRGESGGGALGKIGGMISNIFGGGGGAQAGGYEAPFAPVQGPGFAPDFSKTATAPEKKLLGMKQNTAIMVIGGVGVLIIGGLFMMGRRKRKK